MRALQQYVQPLQCAVLRYLLPVSAANCAERTAFFTAVCAGERDFSAIAVVGGKGGVVTDIFPPCGVCRQVMQEFCEPDFLIYMGRGDDSFEAVRLEEFLPYGFSQEKYMK